VIERPMIIDYEIVCGLRGSVEDRVQYLIRPQNGWQPKGKPILMTHGGCEILVQCMVRYENENKA